MNSSSTTLSNLPEDVLKIIFSIVDGETTIGLIFSSRYLYSCISNLISQLIEVQSTGQLDQTSLSNAVTRRQLDWTLYMTKPSSDYPFKDKCRVEFPLAYRFIMTTMEYSEDKSRDINWK